MSSVRVVGAGVIGLSCAIRLREAGLDANVVAAATGGATTSAAAAALWYPYLVGPADRVRSWGQTSYRELTRLAGKPATGITVTEGTQYLRRPLEAPPWSVDLPDFVVGTDVSPPYVKTWQFAAPVADTSAYLAWLTGRLAELGGSVTTAVVTSADDALRGVDLAVLATGAGARVLPGDRSVRPVRGQVVRVAAPVVRRWVIDDEHPDGLVYVVPRRDDVVCGGIDVEDDSAEDGRAGGRPLPAPDPLIASQILRRCAAVVPEVAGAPVVGHAVGFRPARPSIRLERDGNVIHCYGHGGAGFTVSWGCADEVCRLATG